MTALIQATRGDAAPSLDIDLYADAMIADPYPHYRTLRDLGPAVWLPQHDGWAIGRFEDARSALRDPVRFTSGQGVMMNAPTNAAAAGTSILCMDDPAHADLRRLMAKPLLPAALAPLRDEVRTASDALLDRLVERGRFDGVTDFAHYLPLLLVSRLVGLPADGRESMLDWASGIFNVMGSINARFGEGLVARDVAQSYLGEIDPTRLLPDSWGARLFALAEEGRISDAQARSMLFDYVAPALDTTINGSSSTLWLLGTNPDQWALARAEPALLPAAIEEALRLEAPIRAFSRFVAEDADVDGATIPAGGRALIVYAAADRDERYWPEPDRYDIRRKAPQEHLSFGTGVHMCVGMHLARLEMRSLFDALARRVVRFEVGAIRRTPHNVLRGLAELDITITEVHIMIPFLTRRTLVGGVAAAALPLPAFGAPPMTGKIDTHQHFLPKVYVDAVGLDDLASVMPNKIAPTWSPELALAMMDANGIAEGILSISSGPPIPNAPRLVRQCNDAGADLRAKYPGRFGNFASLPLPDVDASLKETTYALDTLKADGVILFTSYDGKYLGDPAFAPLFDELNRRKTTVFVHPNHPPYKDLAGLPPASVMEFPFDTTRAAASLVMSGAMTRWPDIAFILSHAGGTLPFLASRIVGGVMMNPALAERVGDPMAAIRRFWFDLALSISEPQMKALLAVADPARITFGTDFPMAPPFAIKMGTDGFAKMPLPDAQRVATARGNAARLLGRAA